MAEYYFGVCCASLNNQTIKDEMKIKGVTIPELAERLNISHFELLKRLCNPLPHDMKQEMIDAINDIFLLKSEIPEPIDKMDLMVEKMNAMLLYHEIERKCFDLMDRLYEKNADVFVVVHPLLKTIKEFIDEIKWNEWGTEERTGKECL